VDGNHFCAGRIPFPQEVRLCCAFWIDSARFAGIAKPFCYGLLICLLKRSVPLANQTAEEAQADEMLDCQVMELIRDEILPQSSHYPPQFISKIMILLNKGSIHLVPPGKRTRS
jgi:C-terminal region of Mon2 protein